MTQRNLLRKQRETHRLRKQTYGWIVRELAMAMYVHTAIFKLDNQQGPTG